MMHSESRKGAKVVWLAVHTTEGIMRATALRDWTAWAGSSHASSDETGALLGPADGFVPYTLAAWTLRNGNYISENIEQCGWARWTRAEWLSRPKLLEATARWLAERSVARGIPLVRLSAAEIRARKPGVLGHGDYSAATGDGTHTDPGRNYPWDVVLGRAQQIVNGVAAATQEDDMTPEQENKLDRILEALLEGGGSTGRNNFVWLRNELKPGIEDAVDALVGNMPDGQNNFHWAVGQILTAVATMDPTKPVDAAAIAGLIPEGIAEQVADELVARLARPAR